MSHYFEFNGHQSSAKGLIITGKRTLIGAQRDRTFVSVPGRSGDIVVDNGRYKNIVVAYDFTILDVNLLNPSYSTSADGILNWLCSGGTDYTTLKDDYNPGFYRLAVVENEVELESSLPFMGRGTVKFNCKPFLYQTEAVPWEGYEIGEIFNNPFSVTAQPIIRVTGSGTVTVTVGPVSLRMTFPTGASYLDFDTESMEITYYNATAARTVSGNAYGTMSVNGGLTPGDNAISKTGSGTVSSVSFARRGRKL